MLPRVAPERADRLARAAGAIGDAHDHVNRIGDEETRWALRDILAAQEHLLAALRRGEDDGKEG